MAKGGIVLRIKDVYPSKAQYKKGEKVEIIVEVENIISESKIKCSVFNLHKNILVRYKIISPWENIVKIQLCIDNPKEMLCGYGVKIELYNKDEKVHQCCTAFDILDSWKYAPRYGFLAEFSKEDFDDKEDLKEMNKYHLNVVQYYDWMYRHDDLIPPSDEFTDALGRKLSLRTVSEKINLAHKYNMEAMGYAAVYASSPEFYEKNKDSALYKNNGEAMDFSGFLYLMDISRESKWHEHIIHEFYNAVKFGFDGIHMDQYGFPKEAVIKANGINTVRNLREDFPNLINDTRSYIEGKGKKVSLIFNAVNNWPVETVSKAEEDAVYIEVWPPNDTYGDLYNLISNAKKLTPDKQVILAAYMKPFLKETNTIEEQAENAALLTMASIFASGGFHLLLGENNGILCDAYYPKYRKVSSESFKKKLRSYYDFIVKFEELLYDFNIIDTTMVNTGGINGEYIISGEKASPKAEANSIWTLIKEKPGYKIINLVNFVGVDNMNWNSAKEKSPCKVKDIVISLLTCNEIKAVYLCSPDFEQGTPVKLNFEYEDTDQGRKIKFKIPILEIWDLVYLVY
ncbi:hypothetical protein EQM05_06355 [Clostridium sp. JN-9]|nr:hypothetical protein EQM05_06355 [Clostridium sp. JN-9]